MTATHPPRIIARMRHLLSLLIPLVLATGRGHHDARRTAQLVVVPRLQPGEADLVAWLHGAVGLLHDLGGGRPDPAEDGCRELRVGASGISPPSATAPWIEPSAPRST